jgi:hypothetical protein
VSKEIKSCYQSAVRGLYAGHDAVLLIGADVLQTVFHTLEAAFPELWIIHAHGFANLFLLADNVFLHFNYKSSQILPLITAFLNSVFLII